MCLQDLEISPQSLQFIMHFSASYISAAVSMAFKPKKDKTEGYLIKRFFLIKIIFLLGKSRKSSSQPLKIVLYKSV